MKLEDLKVGDKVWWWFDAGIKPDLMFGTVRKIGKKKVLLESENGDLAWRYPDYIDGRQLQTKIELTVKQPNSDMEEEFDRIYRGM